MKHHKKNRLFGHLGKFPLWKFNDQDLSFSCWYFWHALICTFPDTSKEKFWESKPTNLERRHLKTTKCAWNPGWFHRGFLFGATTTAVIEGNKHLYHLESRWVQLPCIDLSWLLAKPPFRSCAIYFHHSVSFSTWNYPKQLLGSTRNASSKCHFCQIQWGSNKMRKKHSKEKKFNSDWV